MATVHGTLLRRKLSDVSLCFLRAETEPKVSENWYKCFQSLQTSVVETQSTLETEGYIIQRLIYKDSAVFRSQKIMSAIRQVRRCVKTYSELKVASLLTNIVQSWPECEADGCFLPSRDFIDHLLLVLYRGSLVLSTCARYCLHAYSCVQDSLRLQHFVPNMILFTGTLARIWCVSLAFLQDLVACYNSVVSAKHWFPWRDPEVKKISEADLPQCIRHLLMEHKENPEEKVGLWNVWHQFKSDKSSNDNSTNENSEDLHNWSQKSHFSGEDLGEKLCRPANKPCKGEVSSVNTKKNASTHRKSGSDINSVAEFESENHGEFHQEHSGYITRRNESETKTKQDKKKLLKLPASLNAYCQKIYTNGKVFEQFLKCMSKSPCMVKVKGYKMELKFGRKLCAKLSREVSVQKSNLDQQETGKLTKELKFAVKRLEKRLMKAILKIAEKETCSDRLTVDDCSKEAEHSANSDTLHHYSDDIIGHFKVKDGDMTECKRGKFKGHIDVKDNAFGLEVNKPRDHTIKTQKSRKKPRKEEKGNCTNKTKAVSVKNSKKKKSTVKCQLVETEKIRERNMDSVRTEEINKRVNKQRNKLKLFRKQKRVREKNN